MYDDICVETFLKDQLQLFPEIVAETEEEALYFLEDVCAVVCDTKKDVLRYMKDMLDVEGMTSEEILSCEEVFHLPDGRFLIVEG
ncbi:MAG: glyoxalase [Lachnospiraceae bacterium]|nr:glyoxalase [Lachnospiraceae bacterium]